MYDFDNQPDREEFCRWSRWDSGEDLRDYGLTDTSLTLATGPPMPADILSRLAVPAQPERLSLLACRRPADAVFILDFGVANDDAPPGLFAGVLRSWEARFGAVPVMLTVAWTAFQVLSPPVDAMDVDRLAGEVITFAEDSAAQGGFYVRHPDHRAGVRELVQSREWLIWWD
ncbi:MAG: DUF4253 domain-containing protein [Bifidobacteriaceae bacterium]|jgi:hypothetical protein|nr:DUF4253 domain-containing protein [Bifidobacteriaceae bacterium]